MEKLTYNFHVVFDDNGIAIKQHTIANGFDGWDSPPHVKFTATVENALKIVFTHKEYLTFRCVGNLLTGDESKCAEKVSCQQ